MANLLSDTYNYIQSLFQSDPADTLAGTPQQVQQRGAYYNIDDAVAKGIMQRDNIDPLMPAQTLGIDTQKNMESLLAGNKDPISAVGFDPTKVTATDFSKHQKKDGLQQENDFGEYDNKTDRIYLNTNPEALFPNHYLGTLQHEGRHRGLDRTGPTDSFDIINTLLNNTNAHLGDESVVRMGDYYNSGSDDPLSKSQAALYLGHQLRGIKDEATQRQYLNALEDTFKKLQGDFAKYKSAKGK